MIRPARPSDYEAFSRLLPELQVDDPVPSLEKWNAELVPTTVVAEDDSGVTGYAWFQPFADEGIVRNVVVAPHRRGRGEARALLLEVANRLRAKGLRRWSLNVKPGNTPALALYRRLGFVEAYRSRSLRFEWSLVERLPVSSGLESLEVTAADDARVEAAQRLPRGTLAMHRTLPGRVLRGVRNADRFVGAAVFVPSFPGAYPFRADDLGVARVLLEGLRPVATGAVMNAVVEGQPTLAQGLIEHGATVRLEIIHLEGDLPG